MFHIALFLDISQFNKFFLRLVFVFVSFFSVTIDRKNLIGLKNNQFHSIGKREESLIGNFLL